MNCGFVDDDQLLILMAYRMNPKNFILHPISADNPRTLFKHFNLHTVPPKIKLQVVKRRKSPNWLMEIKLALRRSRAKLKQKIEI